LVVGSGDVCELRSVTVNGNILVNDGGTLLMSFSEINGNILGTSAKIISVQHTTITGNIIIDDTGLFTAVAFNTVSGNIDVQGSSSAFSLIVDNVVTGDVIFKGNTFATSNPDGNIVSGNTITGNLDCKNNTQDPTDRYSGPNTVTGSKKGQCKNL